MGLGYEDVRITYQGQSVVMSWDGSEASAPIRVDGDATPYQTADARHRTAEAVRLVCWHVWGPDVGGGPERWADGSEAWDEVSYERATASLTIATRRDLTTWIADVRPDVAQHGLTDKLADAIQAADHPGWGDDWSTWLSENVPRLVEAL